ncbi:OmpA family protein [Flexistipes sp.]|uniref:OmpA family protein n=1 Tax=Flexistipes sp. TaxID=3088135 RepID=UPI002E234797|nr:OmpA family protein [Flexistipes sp.]
MFKKSNLFLVVMIFVFSGAVSSSVLAQEDMEGSKDHPMISRYEGSYIKGYEHYDYGRLTFYTGEENGELQELVPEGEVSRILYFLPPEGLSVLQIRRNYQRALKDAGFEMVYECYGGIDEIPYDIYGDFDNIEGDHSKSVLSGKDESYFLARLPQEDGDVYVSAHIWISDNADADWQPVTALQILEEKPMKSGKIKVDINAETMAKDIEETGSVRIYGIHFDTDKATIKEESESTLAEIAAFLEEKPDLHLGVVGHTDAVGSIEYNMDLSRRRAESVVEFLASEHGISKDRLKPRGLGPWAPVASNEDEDGRARNRRVELIKMLEQ